MPVSELRFFKRCAEFQPQAEYRHIPINTRGIYALLRKKPNKKFDVVYIGMARGEKTGVRGRLWSHMHSPKKRGLWTHFSVYEVWDNITSAEVEELEGMFRAIYRKDLKANQINRQRSFKKLRNVRKNKLAEWKNAH